MLIYIVRHGETNLNRRGLLQGWINDTLNQFGIQLAEQTGRAMMETKFDIAFSSPLDRAKTTAEIILKESGNDCPLIIDNRIKEIHFGDFEGKKFNGEEAEVDSSIIQQFLIDPMAIECFPHGEHVTDVMKRTQEFLIELSRKDYQSVLVSTHGCALRCMLNFLYENPKDFWHGHVPYNCVVNIVEASKGKMRLIGDDIVYYDKNLCVDRYSKS